MFLLIYARDAQVLEPHPACTLVGPRRLAPAIAAPSECGICARACGLASLVLLGRLGSWTTRGGRLMLVEERGTQADAGGTTMKTFDTQLSKCE